MESIFEFIDLLSILRFNEFQLYIEHTFAFQNHRDVWKDSSPLSGEEIQKIDHYCTDRFIDLVPNLNSFGHFERWLRHKPYKILRNARTGFIEKSHLWLGIMARCSSLIKKAWNSLILFTRNICQIFHLPNLMLDWMSHGNWAKGWSKSIVEKEGKHKVSFGLFEWHSQPR